MGIYLKYCATFVQPARLASMMMLNHLNCDSNENMCNVHALYRKNYISIASSYRMLCEIDGIECASEFRRIFKIVAIGLTIFFSCKIGNGKKCEKFEKQKKTLLNSVHFWSLLLNRFCCYFCLILPKTQASRYILRQSNASIWDDMQYWIEWCTTLEVIWYTQLLFAYNFRYRWHPFSIVTIAQFYLYHTHTYAQWKRDGTFQFQKYIYWDIFNWHFSELHSWQRSHEA